MASCTTEDGWHALADGHKVYIKSWKPKAPPAAILLFIHGFSDHIETHHTLFATLASRNIRSHAFDQRGWGRSVQRPSQKGLTGHTSTVLDDITSVLKSLLPSAASTSTPFFLMGHSMGGAEVLQYAARGPPDIRAQIRGYVLESPYIALHPSSQPSRALAIAGKLAARVMPRRQMVNKLDPMLVCRDEQVCKEYDQDELCHDTGTLQGLAGMLERADHLDTGVVVVKEGRFWTGHGDADHICDFGASKRLFERLAVDDKEFKTYKGWYHKLHAEPGEDKFTFANDVADWILARSGSEIEDTKSKL